MTSPVNEAHTDREAAHGRLLEVWQRTGELSALWPDVAASDRRSAHAWIRNTTGMILAPRTRRPTLAMSDEREQRSLGVVGFISGMGPLVGWWIERGMIDTSTGARDLFARHLEHGRRRATLLRSQLARVVQTMRAAGIELIVLKGLHTGAEYFPDPGTRPAADIDLLVEPAQRARAAVALGEAGFVERRSTRFAARSEWVPAGRPQQIRALDHDHVDNPWSVDLHTSLDRWYFRGLRRGLGDAAFQHTTTAMIGDERVRVLAQPFLAAFLATHASYELVQTQLVRLVEIVLVTRQDVREGRLDWDDLASLLQRTATDRFAYPALALAENLAPGTVPHPLLEGLEARTTARTQRVLDAVRAADLAPLMHRLLDTKLMWASGPRELLLNLSELVLPSDDGLPIEIARLHWRRLRALARGAVGWRARAGG